MKILVVADIHNDYIAAKTAWEVQKPDYVLDCGDHSKIKNIFELTPHLYIYGNHEPREVMVPDDGMPLPFKIDNGIVLKLPVVDFPMRTKSFIKGKSIQIAGLDGNYSFNNHDGYNVTQRSVDYLKLIPEGGIDILLTHECPLLVPDDSNHKCLANQVVREIDRIKPKIVFSGHAGRYLDLLTPGDIRNIVLEDMAKGYSVLDSSDFSVKRERARFR